MKRPAVLLLDCEEGVAERVFADAGHRADFVGAVTAVIDHAATRGWPVVRVEVEFRPDHVEVASSNTYFSAVKAAGRLQAGSQDVAPMNELLDRISSLPRVVKRRIGAFAGTDLAHVLRGMDVDGIIVAGLIASGAVLSTVCHAADSDYRVVVVDDACHDPDPQVKNVLMATVLPMRAQVLSSTTLVGSDR